MTPGKLRAKKVAGVVQRQMTKKKNKDLVKKKKANDLLKDSDNLFSKEDPDEKEAEILE